MIFSKSKQPKHRRFEYEPRYADNKKKKRSLTFSDSDFMGRAKRMEEAGQRIKFDRESRGKTQNKLMRYGLFLAIMAVVYIMYSDRFSFALGGELGKVLVGFGILFILIIVYIKKTNTA